MALRIRFQYPTGSALGYSIERLADGLFYDFGPPPPATLTGGTFTPVPGAPIAPLPEDVPPFKGRYKLTLDPTPAAVFEDGDYVVTIHDRGGADMVVAELAATMHGGDDATFMPTVTGPSAPGVDPWSVPLPGAYAPGTAGAMLGQPIPTAGAIGEGVALAIVGQTLTVGLTVTAAAFQPRPTTTG